MDRRFIAKKEFNLNRFIIYKKKNMNELIAKIKELNEAFMSDAALQIKKGNKAVQKKSEKELKERGMEDFLKQQNKLSQQEYIKNNNRQNNIYNEYYSHAEQPQVTQQRNNNSRVQIKNSKQQPKTTKVQKKLDEPDFSDIQDIIALTLNKNNSDNSK